MGQILKEKLLLTVTSKHQRKIRLQNNKKLIWVKFYETVTVMLRKMRYEDVSAWKDQFGVVFVVLQQEI